jgi:hypothetical protein
VQTLCGTRRPRHGLGNPVLSSPLLSWLREPLAQGYLVKNGTSRGQPRAWCTACEARVVLRYETAYDGLEADAAICETAVRALAEGNALRAIARIVHVDKDTVCASRYRVACHCRTVMLYFWHNLHVSTGQRDELWSFVHTKEAHLPGAKSYGATSGEAWVWIAFAPVQRLVLAYVIGKRDQAGADLCWPVSPRSRMTPLLGLCRDAKICISTTKRRYSAKSLTL